MRLLKPATWLATVVLAISVCGSSGAEVATDERSFALRGTEHAHARTRHKHKRQQSAQKHLAMDLDDETVEMKVNSMAARLETMQRQQGTLSSVLHTEFNTLKSILNGIELKVNYIKSRQGTLSKIYQLVNAM